MAKASEKYEVMYIINPNLSEEETAAVVEKFKSIMNDLAEDKTEAEIQELLHIFAQSTYYEFLFWDDAYTHNSWTVD